MRNKPKKSSDEKESLFEKALKFHCSFCPLREYCRKKEGKK